MRNTEKLKVDIALSLVASARQSTPMTYLQALEAVERAVDVAEVDLDAPALTARDVVDLADFARHLAALDGTQQRIPA